MEIEQLLRSNHRWLVAHAGYLDGRVLVQLVAVGVAPAVEIGQPCHCAKDNQLEPSVEGAPDPGKRHQQTQADEPAQNPGHEPELGKVIRMDGVHPDVMIQIVDAVQVVGLGPGDPVYPDPEPQPFGILRRVQLNLPERQQVQGQQDQRCRCDSPAGDGSHPH